MATKKKAKKPAAKIAPIKKDREGQAGITRENYRAPDPDEAELERFMFGIRQQESGHRYKVVGPNTKYGKATGAYQFLDSTWAGYKGYKRAADAPPEVQDQRARELMTHYFRKYGSWEAVAVAWHAGPGNAEKVARRGMGAIGNLGDVNMPTRKYATNVLSFMKKAPTKPGGGGGVGAGGGPPAAIAPITEDREGQVGLARQDATAPAAPPPAPVGMAPPLGNPLSTPGRAGAGGAGTPGATAVPAAKDPKDMTPNELKAEVAKRFGSLMLPYLSHPELGPLLFEAIRNQFAPDQFQARLMQTGWWQTTSESMRTFDAQLHLDPATTNRSVQNAADAIIHTARRIGTQLTGPEAWELAIKQLREGWTAEQVEEAVENKLTYNVGDVRGEAAKWDAYARQTANDYLVRIPDEDLGRWVVDLARQNVTPEQFGQFMKNYAKSYWPTLAGAIDQGLTPKQFMAPYAGIIEDELGIPSAQIDWFNPKYQRFARKPTDKGFQAMDLWEVQQEIRSNPIYKWDESKLGRAIGAEKANGILGLMGAIG